MLLQENRAAQAGLKCNKYSISLAARRRPGRGRARGISDERESHAREFHALSRPAAARAGDVVRARDLVPASGLLRIDPSAGALVVLDRQIWFADFFLIAGLWIMLASALVMLYSVAGTVFCGWVCPQNILSEWANFVTRKFLGRRAKVAMDGSAPLVATTKDKALNWVLLGLSLLAAALVVGIVPLFYFYAPATVWSFVTWRADPRSPDRCTISISFSC
jgi:hypothetical protein